MQAILALKEPLEGHLKSYLARHNQSIYAPVKYILGIGGKRIRPCLLMAVAQGYGADISSSLPAAAAIEVFHNFTLLHDDIMDAADQRRGHETVHLKWNEAQAILSGDIMFSMSYELLLESNSEALKGLLDVFTRTGKEVCEGQQMDMEFETRADVSEPEYMEMIKLKTSVLLAAAAAMGAEVGGADSAEIDMMYEVGLAMGLCFQIQDDLLDAFGAQAAVGKRIGGDIIQNKKTLLYLRAYALCDNVQRESLERWYAQTEGDEAAKITAVKAIMQDCGAVEELKRIQADYQDQALAHLDKSGLSNPWKLSLIDLINEQSKRSF